MNSDSASQNLDKKKAQKIVSWANEQFVKMKNERSSTERQWYLNLAFYFGKQNVQMQTSVSGNNNLERTFKLYTPPAPYYRARPVINLLRPRIRKQMAKLTAQKPNIFVVPASSDDRDLYAAQAGENIWDYLYTEHKVANVLRRSVFWLTVTGNGFIKNWWDPEKPDYFSDQKGDVCFEPVTPFHFFVPDLREVDLEKQPYVLHASLQSADYLSMCYGRDIKFNKAESDKLEDSFLNVMGLQNWQKNKQVLVLEYWIKPGCVKQFPKGAMFTVAGNELIQYLDYYPYEHGKFPFAHVYDIETGKFYRDSVLIDLIPLQREYNRTRGQIIEAKNRMAKPQLAAEIGSLDPSKITTEPGQVIMYRPGFQAPQPIPLQSLPGYVLEEQERIKLDIDDISGQHDVSRGDAPPGVTAATAISYLQEQDESQLSYTFDSIEEAMEKLGYLTLNYVSQYWDTERKIKVTGKDSTFDIMTLDGSDLRDNTDVKCEGGSALPTSRAAKQAFIMDLMKFGFIDPQKGLEVMEIGGVNKLYEQIQVDIRQAQRENLKMAAATAELIQQDHMEKIEKYLQSPEAQSLIEQGLIFEGPNGDILDASPMLTGAEQPAPLEVPLLVPVNTWDDHRLHIERHNNFRKSQTFEQLPDEAKDLFEQHVRQHVSAIMVGAAGALPPETLDPETMSMAMDNQEAYKEMDFRQGEENGSAPSE